MPPVWNNNNVRGIGRANWAGRVRVDCGAIGLNFVRREVDAAIRML